MLLGLAVLLLSGAYAHSKGQQEMEQEPELFEGVIMTVRGPIAASEFGMALTHEHIAGAFVNLDQVGELSYDRDAFTETMFPFLQGFKNRGFSGLVEATTVDLSRDVVVLRRLSELTDLHILTNTGNYGAFGDAFLLPYVFEEDADQLTARWVREWNEGIDGTGIKPGYIKIGVDPGPLSEVDHKLVQAAARTHLQTGLTIACHTGEAQAALEVLESLRRHGVHPSAFIVLHSDYIDQEIQFQLAETGAWISFDGANPMGLLSIEQRVALIKGMLEKGYGDRVLLSHSSGWYTVSDPGDWLEFEGERYHPTKIAGKTSHGWFAISDQLIPALREAEVSEEQIRKLMLHNPARAFSVKVRTEPLTLHEWGSCSYPVLRTYFTGPQTYAACHRAHISVE